MAGKEDERLYAFISDLNAQDTVAGKWGVLLNLIKQYGFSGANYVAAPTIRGQSFSKELLCFSSYDPDFIRLYTEEHLADGDFAYLHSRKGGKAALWSKIKTLYPEVEGSLFNEVTMDFGLREGLSIPFNEKDGLMRRGLGVSICRS